MTAFSDIVAAATALRHHLHRHPELAWQEHQTAATIRAELDKRRIPWQACADTGTLARLAPGAQGAHVALRGDIDALPITEATGTDYASQTPGLMHACGHDGHTATLLAAGAWLKAHEAALPGPVTLLFQPAEEGGHGADRMVREGALHGIDVIYGWHNWPGIPYGMAVCPDGPVMAANGTFRVDIQGTGGHASQPDQCRDPVLAASAITLALQQVVARRLAPQAATVISVTWIDAPSADTIIPDRVALGGSIRAADPALREPMRALMQETIEHTARAYGVEATFDLRLRYGATVNEPGAAARMRSALADVLGRVWHSAATPVPLMASEDFSCYLENIPGAFALIGADDGQGHHIACHHPRYDFNDRLIDLAARVLIRLAGGPPPHQEVP